MRTIKLFNHYIHKAHYLLVLVETLLCFCAFYLGTYFYFFQQQAVVSDHLGAIWPRALVFSLVTVVSMTAMGLYKPQLRDGPSGILLRLLSAFVISVLGMSLLFYLLPNLHLWRGAFVQILLTAFVLILLSRWCFQRLINIEELKSRVLVLGAGQKAATALSWLRRKSDRSGFTFVGFVRITEERVQVEGEQVLNSDQSLLDLVLAKKVDQIVVAVDDRRKVLPVEDLLACRMAGVQVQGLASFFERESSRIMLEFIDPSWLAFSDGFGRGSQKLLNKRLFDITTSLLLLMMTWPLMLLAVVAIWIEDGFGAPVLYRQQRVGMNGDLFDLLKLRSMSVDAEGDGKARWAEKNDQRVTRVGSVIRRLRIDELPQILNILYGEMSLVGPRPERPEFVSELAEKIPYYNSRHLVKPGIAGWAQLHYPYGASEEDARKKLQYELYYVKNQSLFLDFMIILSTTEIVLFGEGVR
ncbi:TIGR03013 family PEP-CTERM/XrtA system glycosyltransferase [Parahaliea sp. F7430]|uniref:TIGR03013 family PEP-CTERM/XrtA system glycosyltransferase n=1 Tax=Sediminihaliea albiluteola TaxID=2758564 RepID=A0A7W2TVL0_9GAMM|nr:TIGR03013 family XrtA/PEP-CTERM system glycosyltransferase [Sediminihaliea albiluteola]MBA6412679.1 TIGR03013 family PEP-CTERM/XrtA system glycosyltransferase [Sediminihaliea albiluteola]